jgi:hypothetical protein
MRLLPLIDCVDVEGFGEDECLRRKGIDNHIGQDFNVEFGACRER